MKYQPKMSTMQALFRGALLCIWVAVLVSLAAFPLPVSAAVCPAGKRCVFVPSVIKAGAPKASIDLAAVGVEVNQAIQNEKNSIPLVAGRPAILRIFSQAIGNSQPVSGVKVSITATRSGAMLTGAPAMISATIPLTISRSSYNNSINFPLPAAWLSGAVDLTIRLDPDNQLAETNEGNNQIVQRLVFNNVPPLNVKIIPVQYNHTGNGPHIYPAPSIDTISDWIRRTFPVNQVNISWHAPYAFTGNLSSSTDFNRLLNEITTLKSSERAPSAQVYYALVPTVDGNYGWFYGGIAGIGWIGNRVSIGLDMSGNSAQIAAHEIGHNLGMGHTPCGVTHFDTNFPYSDGSIGQYGLDTATGTLYPPTSKDVMSYCNPKWVSDYTYKVLFNSQIQYGALEMSSEQAMLAEAGKSSQGSSLMVRATIREGGVEMHPTYFFSDQAADAPAGDSYTVQVLGSAGDVLVEHAVQAAEIVLENEEHLEGIHALVPAPDAPVSAVRLLKDGQVVAEQRVRSGGSPRMAVEPAADGVAVQWEMPENPVLVRYSEDGGATWTTLGVDVPGGRLDVTRAMAPNAGGNAKGSFQVVPANTWK